MEEIIPQVGDFLKKTGPLLVAVISILAFKRYNKKRQFQLEERKLSVQISKDFLEEIRKERDSYREEAQALRNEVKELSVQNGKLEQEVHGLREKVEDLIKIINELKNKIG